MSGRLDGMVLCRECPPRLEARCDSELVDAAVYFSALADNLVELFRIDSSRS